MTSRFSASALCGVCVLIVGATPIVAGAQASCSKSERTSAASGVRWQPPLDRLVSIHERGVALRDALDRLAAAARIRLAYAAELLPLDRRVCVSYGSISAGAALTELLEGAAVEPIVTDSDRVVLAPHRAQLAATSGFPATTSPRRRAGVLERVVVTGTVNGSPQRAMPVALDVVDGRELARHDARTLSSILDGSVPGIWIWEQSPTNLLARYASIRGASSFGISYPKVYIDGIEVANSLLVTELDVESVDHVEVIRGPQGAALYGADAISGVINIVTRHDGTEGGAPRAQLQSGAGMAASTYSPGGVLTQRHSLTMRTGSGVGSAGLGLSISTLGDFIPGAYDRRFALNGGARRAGRYAIISGTARFVAQDAGAPTSPLLAAATAGPASPPLIDSTFRQSVRQYTVGATATMRRGNRWTHSAVIGLDGYSLKDASATGTPFTSAADSALRAARGTAARGTVRVSSVAQLGTTDHASGSLTLAVEHSAVREASRLPVAFGPDAPPDDYGATERTVNWRSNTGLITQVNGAFRDVLFVTGGVRLEHNGGVSTSERYATLPMVGAAYVRELGGVAVKFRAAYGKGIRPPETTSRATSWMGMRASEGTTALASEVQSGVEGGMDLLLGRAVGLHVTRFDQLVSGLIQPVAVSGRSGPGPGPGPGGGGGGGGGGGPNERGRIAYVLQNVGEITNRGWELAGSVGGRALSVTSALSFVDSRVRRLASGYSGDLQRGDRMLEVPARTLSVTASYAHGPWSTSVTGARAYDWVNYDRLALTRAFTSGQWLPRDVIGAQLRTYWREYSGVNRLRANASYDLRRALSLVISADNLLDHQLGEPDNVTVLPGRTITGGLRAKF
jgi:iron complex outermembrane receptor protein